MRKSTLLSLIWLALLPAATPAADAATTIESRPAIGPITLDGRPADWEGIPVVYLEESLRALAVTHDQDNLYLMYRFADERLARELLARGVILWVNSEGKTKNKDEAYGLRYGGSSQIERSFEEAPRPSQGNPPDDSHDDRRPPRPPGPERDRARPDELTRIRLGVKEPVAGTSDAEPAAASAAAEDGFCYELRIPIGDIGGKVAAQAPSETHTIAVGIQIGGLTQAEAEAMESAPPEMPGGGGAPPGGGGGARGGMGGMGGPGGGGPPIGGPPAGGPGGMKKRLAPEITWLKVVLRPAS
jgi:hypothetical protein